MVLFINHSSLFIIHLGRPLGFLRFMPSYLVVPIPCCCTFRETCTLEDCILAKLMLDGYNCFLHLTFLISLCIPLFLING